MTYAAFLAFFILPPIAVLLAIRYAQHRRRPSSGRAWAIPATAAIAFLYTTPWDNYLVYRGVWTYGADRVLAVIGYVPVEEYAFFVLQPILAGLLVRVLLRDRTPETKTPWHNTVHTWIWVLLSVLGWGLLVAGGAKALYLGLILGWAGPVLAGLWWYGGAHMLRLGWPVWTAIAVSTVYLWVCDRIAIGLGIWNIPPTYSTGWHLLGLPIEEALFFLITVMLSVLGTLLFAHGTWIAPPPLAARLWKEASVRAG